MSETINRSPKRSGWLRKLAWIAGVLVILLVVVYFVATSAFFLKSVILPQVSKGLGAEVTVTDADISPFSHVALHGLKVQSPGAEALLTVPELHANYSLPSILGGNIVVAEVVIESPVVTVVQNADGTSNLEAFTKTNSTAAKPAAKPATPTASKPTQIDIKKIALNNATVRLVKKYANGSQDLTEVTGLTFTVTNLKNGQAGKIEVAALIAVQKAAQTNAAAATLQAKLAGGFDLALTPDCQPASAQGSTTFTITQATGPLADLAAFAATLNCNLTTTELKDLALRFTKGGASLGEIRLNGPFDTAKSEGKLKLEISGIDQQALNLAGAASGMDFGTTTFNSTNAIDLSNGGKLIALTGGFNLAKLQVKQKTQVSPTLDLLGNYSVTVDQTAQTAVLQTLNLTGSQDARPFMLVGLSSPMTIPLGGTSSTVGDATLDLVVTNLNLADWKALAGESAPGGLVNVAVKLVSQKGGQQLGFQMDTHLDNLTTGTGSAAVNQGSVRVQASGSVANLKQIKLDSYQLNATRQGQALVTVSGSATFDSATQDADLQVAVQAALGQLMAVPGAGPTNGLVSFKGHITNQQKKLGLTGELALTPTDRATNTLQLSGNVDVSQPDAITGTIKVAAAALDVTAYYDLMASLKPATNAPVAAAAPASPPAPATDQEPAAMKLPLKNFTFDLNIGHLFLHEVDIASWQTTALMDGGHVVLKPCQLALNGAPVKATVDLDLGVPGYVYDVAFNGDTIPLAPLVNSFSPDRKGQIGGTTSLGMQLKGAGVTGTSLQKNLTGQFDFATTNMALSIANVRSPLMNNIINVIVGLPDLIRNPAAALGSLFGSTKSGFADTLTASPIEEIDLQAIAGSGQVQLKSAKVQSAAFQALASGQITLATNLNNSAITIPVQVTLSRSLGGQIGLVEASTPTNAAYVALPDFLKMQGTLGQPKAQIDKLALVALAAKTGGGILKGIGGAGGEKASSAIGVLGGLLGGKTTATNSAPATTNKSPAAGLLNLFKR